MNSFDTYSDESIFLLMKTGDEPAFTELYNRYWKRLLVKANMLLNSCEDAEEIVHDIFVNLWKKKDTIEITHTFHAYIAAMLQYGCFKVLADRKRSRIRKSVGELPETADSGTQQLLDFEDLRRELEAAISALPDKCQLIFRLSREQGLSDKEIAGELDISVNTVRTQIHRALTRLKTGLNTFFLM